MQRRHRNEEGKGFAFVLLLKARMPEKIPQVDSVQIAAPKSETVVVFDEDRRGEALRCILAC
jgi:hypothetical protein